MKLRESIKEGIEITMKTIIIAVSIICSGAGLVKAEGESIGFDTPCRGSLTSYLTAKADFSGANVKSIPEQPAAKNTEKGTPPKKLFFVKDLLKELSSKDRAEFMSGIKLINGRVASQNYAVLEKNGLSGARIAEILSAFEFREESAASSRSVDEIKMVSLGQLLSGVPQKIKEEFIDNMKFLNGSVASVKSEWPENDKSAVGLAGVVDALMPAMRRGPGSASRTVIKEATCEAWVHNDKIVEYGCSSTEDSTCNTSVCK